MRPRRDTAARPRPGARSRRAGGRLVRRGLSALFFAAALYLIWRQLSGISWGAFLIALAATSPWAIGASLLLTACSYACLSLTERLCALALGHPLSLAQAARIAVPSYALTNSAGFSPVTGTALRLQLYGRLGIRPRSATAIAVLAGTAVTLSGVVALGICFLLDPASAARAIHGPRVLVLAASAVMISLAALWFIAFSRQAPRWLGGGRGTDLALERRAVGLAAGLGDWLFSGLALFVLLQTTPLAGAPAFLAAYVAGCLLSAATGVPGGVGVFEAIVLGLSAVVSQAHETAAALLLYRCIYSLLPLSGVGALSAWRAFRARGSPGTLRASGGDKARRAGLA
jgi:phosphatidylglycerol lysyltransferase